MRRREIHVKPDAGKIEIGGWLGENLNNTYVWFGMDGHCIGHVSGRKLVRLCKAIIRRADRDE